MIDEKERGVQTGLQLYFQDGPFHGADEDGEREEVAPDANYWHKWRDRGWTPHPEKIVVVGCGANGKVSIKTVITKRTLSSISEWEK